MRMIRAVIRPNREENVMDALELAGAISLTRMDVSGKALRGVQVGNTIYSATPQIMLIVVIEEETLDAAVAAMQEGAKTGQHGDGKIYISPVDTAYTVRTGEVFQEQSGR